MIIFEIVHEKAWPITRFSICRNIKLGYDIFPIETVVYKCKIEDHNHKDQNKNDFDAKNCEEGKFITIDEQFNDPTTLSNTIKKLRHGFFDDPEKPNNFIVDEKFRQSDKLAEQAKYILEELGCYSDTDLDKLKALTYATQNTEEFTQYPTQINITDTTKQSKQIVIEEFQRWKVDNDAPINFDQIGGKKYVLKNMFNNKSFK